MILLVQPDYLPEDPATRVGVLAVVAGLGLGLWALIRWLVSGPLRPDPWGDEVTAELAKDEATPLCHRCLTPHDPRVDFCPDCGAPVGLYTNWLPYPYLFSIGHTLRIGTSGDFRHSPLTIAGFFLLGIAEYALFAPIYWFMLFRSLFHDHASDPRSEQNPPASEGPPGDRTN